MSKRKTYSLNFKLDAVKYAEANSLSKAADHCRVHISQIKRWKSQKELIEAKPNKLSKVAHRLRGEKWPLLETYLLHWIKEQQKENKQVSGTSILKEARQQAEKMNLHDFKGSPNWIFKFMKRHCIARKEMTTTTTSKKTKTFEVPCNDSDDEEVREKLMSFLIESKF